MSITSSPQQKVSRQVLRHAWRRAGGGRVREAAPDGHGGRRPGGQDLVAQGRHVKVTDPE